ncbi:sulfite exporter TauE/SafE family protein [Streptomyces sp. NPDC053741]|uniref:sulfite exporter TauE/SafE family protein n=1 Tax=unclassified Streptomyces TaxID=2593676 RepID=UPI001649D336|nr:MULTISPECIES: sulfite exporter TauE/SafE family protein [Streptomyces]MCX4413180.1 sulfite exporter TauE/SafE family protein [[Kitasatospora] papulosa]MDF6061726.1 sulfite exporter TauE/SafE family protein [Streptomyces sp. JH010]MDX2622974.1 sulfite exporter TauE/SafE family protein [Streptomyces sp. WI03-5b]WJY30776.1 sulfite exporter TauE/SafE family protein [Streptomyces sp. P9-2B-1]WSK31186.1 sulfite exporter TauE/SafE family protein [[Kitasatospora] papulosa]
MALSIWEMLAVFAAGIGAGTINTIVGSGTLITFPVLLATGLPPVTATVSNALGLIPGSISGAIGYRAELAGQCRRTLKLGVGALIGGLAGAALLLSLPSTAFETIVPVLVALALVLVILQPRISRAVQRRRERTGTSARPDGGPLLFTGLMLASVYGGYFTAAQGIIYLSLMGMLLDDTMQRLNAVKNVLAAVVNSVAALFFLFVADFDWTAVVLIAVGSAIGGQVGAKVGRRLSPGFLRALIVVVGTAAIVQLLLR